MTTTTFYRGEDPLRADKLNQAFSERVSREGDTMAGMLTLAQDPIDIFHAATKQYVDTSIAGISPGTYLPIGGGTMEGDLLLYGPPTSDMMAVTKKYVDDNIVVGAYLPLTGGTLTGVLTLAFDPALPLQAATKQYVDNRVTTGSASLVVSDTPPVPVSGGMWFSSADLQLYVNYQDPTGSPQWVPATNTPLPFDTYAPLSMVQANVGRNLVHNGLFNVAQRGGGPFTTSGYTLDRWTCAVGGGTVSVSQTAAGDYDRSSIGDEAVSNIFTCVGAGTSGAGDYVISGEHHIEDVRRLSGKTVTLTFWARVISGPATSKLGIDLYQNFGTGGSPSAIVKLTAQAVTLAAGWVRYTTTWNIPSIAGKTFGTTPNTSFTAVQLWMSSGATNNADAGGIGVQSYTLGLWGVQLEIGSVATPLEKIEYADDLQHCQRFFERRALAANEAIGVGTTQTNFNPPTAYFVMLPFKVTKRAAPTITTSAVGSFFVAGMAASGISTGSSADTAWMHVAAPSGSTNASWTCVPVQASGSGATIDYSADL